MVSYKKNQRDFQLEMFYFFTYRIVVFLNFLTFLSARHIRSARDEKGGIILTIMKVFIKDFFFPIELYTCTTPIVQ